MLKGRAFSGIREGRHGALRAFDSAFERGRPVCGGRGPYGNSIMGRSGVEFRRYRPWISSFRLGDITGHQEQHSDRAKQDVERAPEVPNHITRQLVCPNVEALPRKYKPSYSVTPRV